MKRIARIAINAKIAMIAINENLISLAASSYGNFGNHGNSGNSGNSGNPFYSSGWASSLNSTWRERLVVFLSAPDVNSFRVPRSK